MGINDVFDGGEYGDAPSTDLGALEAPSIATPAAAQDGDAPTDGQATATDQGENLLDGPTEQATDPNAQPDPQDAGQEPPKPTDEEVMRMEQEVESALNDERTPKWFKNVVENVYKPKLEEFGKQVEQFSALGTPEELTEQLALVRGLNEIRFDPDRGMPVRSTENFVKTLYEKDPQGAYQLMNDLATLPSPITDGLTVTQELLYQMGIDPQRLEDVKRFAENGYSMTESAYPAPDPEDLAYIPQHLHATFARLDPDTRNSIMADDERVRNGNLEAHRVRLEHEEATKNQEQRQAEERQQYDEQQRQQFVQAVEQKGQEYFERTGESIVNSFVNSLAQQAGMPKLDAMMVTNTVLNALEPTLAGRMSLEALKAEGVQIDPQIPGIIAQLEQKAKIAASYELVRDQQSLQAVVSEIGELQEKLVAKGNKVIAALAMKRNGGGARNGTAANALAQQTSRHAMAGSAAGITAGSGSSRPPQMDFSDEGYMDDLLSDPRFGGRR